MVSARVNVAVLIAVALLCLCAGFFFYPFGSGGAKEAAKKTQCLSNLKQMGKAMQLYMIDHNDLFPSGKWHDPILPYLEKEQPNGDIEGLFTCPSLFGKKEISNPLGGYALNLEMAGKPPQSVPNPEKKPLLFETNALGLDVIANIAARSLDRHPGYSNGNKIAGSNILRVDGSAKYFAAEAKVE